MAKAQEGAKYRGELQTTRRASKSRKGAECQLGCLVVDQIRIVDAWAPRYKITPLVEHNA